MSSKLTFATTRPTARAWSITRTTSGTSSWLGSRCSRRWGMTTRIWSATGSFLVVHSISAKYHRPARFGDRLRIETQGRQGDDGADRACLPRGGERQADRRGGEHDCLRRPRGEYSADAGAYYWGVGFCRDEKDAKTEETTADFADFTDEEKNRSACIHPRICASAVQRSSLSFVRSLCLVRQTNFQWRRRWLQSGS